MDSEAPLIQTAMEVVARATTSSSVLSFNLTGVVILVILKIAIIAYTLLNTNDLGLSLFGARSLNTLTTAPGYSHADLTGAMCFLLYTNGDENKMECLARATCESPAVSGDYLMAAQGWSKLSQLMDMVPFNKKYTSLLDTLEMSNKIGTEGGDCSQFSW